jgi:hypothetical protein
MPRTEAFSKNLHMAGSRTDNSVQPAKDILIRAKDLGIRIWALESTNPSVFQSDFQNSSAS